MMEYTTLMYRIPATKIIKFYEETPFPNYKDLDDKASLLEIEIEIIS